MFIIEGIHSFYPMTANCIGKKIFLYATAEDTKELRFLADLFERNYSAHLAFKRADIEFNEFEKHIFQYICLADKVVQVNNYWKYSLGETIPLP